jgi:type IV pilus assembly protein PilQ
MWQKLTSDIDGGSRLHPLTALVLAAALLAPAVALARGSVDTTTEAFAKAGAPAVRGGSAELLSLDFVPEDGRTVIGLTATGPLLNHTAWQERGKTGDIVVVELPGVDSRQIQPLAQVGTEQVDEVRTTSSELSGRPSTKLEIARTPGARHQVSVDPQNPHRLLISIPNADSKPAAQRAAVKPAAAPATVLASREPEAPAQPAAAPPQPAAERATRVAEKPIERAQPRQEAELVRTRASLEPRPVTQFPPRAEPLRPSQPSSLRALAESTGQVVRLRDAQVSRAEDGRTMLRVFATGPMEAAKPFLLDDPPRLVVDIPGAVAEVSSGVFRVRENGVFRVRVRQNQPLPEPVTRIVFDLESGATPYELVSGPDSLAVLVGQRGSAALTPKMAAVSHDATKPAWNRESAVSTPASSQLPAGMQDLASLGRPGGFAGSSEPVPARSGARLPASKPMREAAGSSGALISQPRSSNSSTLTFETVTLDTEEPEYTGEPISVAFKDADLQDLFRMFKQISGLNIIVDSDLKGETITLDVTDVPWDQVMALVMKTNNLGSSFEGNVLRIAPLNKLAREEQQKKALLDARELAGEVSTIARQLSYAQGAAADQLVRRSLSARGTSQLDKRTNTLIIKDITPRIKEIESLLDLIDQPTRQVMIEARIVETTKDFTKAVGITWGLNYIADRAFGNSTNFSFPRSWGADYAVNLPVSAATSTLGLSFRNILNTFSLDLAIQAAEQRGRARIISAPRIMVQNNEEAEIESGVQIPIVNTTATEIEVTFVSASLRLKVQPQITADDTIIMDVDLENNQPIFIQTVGDNASIATRRASTVVAVPDGGTTVIGGIYQVNEGVSQGRVPFFSRVPLLGWLFRNKQIDRTNDELIIFLTPSIQKI